VPTDELKEMIRLWALERWPRRPVVRLTIELADGDKVKMPMPDCPYRPAPPGVSKPSRPSTS
jgi:hypothetical protein